MKLSKNYEGKIRNNRFSINDTETHIRYQFEWCEIQEDQEGVKYFVSPQGEMVYPLIVSLQSSPPVREGMPDELPSKIWANEENETWGINGQFSDGTKFIADSSGLTDETKEILEEICKRYNAFPGMLEALKEVTGQLIVFSDMEVTNKNPMNAAIKKAQAIINSIKQ